MASQILYGLTGQVLSHVPMGVVSAAAYTLEDLHRPIGDAARVIGSGTPTQANWTVTSTAVAGATSVNPRRISTATTAGSIGAPGLLVAPDGTRELVEIAAISANSYVDVVSPLSGTYPIGSVLYGVLLTCPVPDDFAASETKLKEQHALRVTWAYTLAGVKQLHPVKVEFNRHDMADAVVGEAVLWIDKMYDDARTRLSTKLEIVVALLAVEVGDDLRARRIDPSKFMTGTRGRGLLVSRTLAHLGELGWSPGNTPQEDWSVAAWRNYRAKLSSLTVGEAGFNTAETGPDDTTATNPDRKSRSIFMQM